MALAPHGPRESEQDAKEACAGKGPGKNDHVMRRGLSRLDSCGVDATPFLEKIAHHAGASLCQASRRGASATEIIVHPRLG